MLSPKNKAIANMRRREAKTKRLQVQRAAIREPLDWREEALIEYEERTGKKLERIYDGGITRFARGARPADERVYARKLKR